MSTWSTCSVVTRTCVRWFTIVVASTFSMGGIAPFHRIHSWRVNPKQLPPPNQWLTSCPPTALKNKNIQVVPSHAIPLLHTRIMRATGWFTSCYIQPHKFRWFGRHSRTHTCIHLLTHTQRKLVPSQTDESTATDCPNETHVHCVLFQHQQRSSQKPSNARTLP